MHIKKPTKLNYEVIIKIKIHENFQSIDYEWNWCHDNIKGRWFSQLDFHKYIKPDEDKNIHVAFWFEDKSDAAHFKLKFG